MILPYFIFAVCGFISGSIMYSYIVAKHFYNVDITVDGPDGNPGMTNVMLCVGKKQGLLCLLLDVQKGAVPVLVASTILDPSNPWFALVLVSPVLGHAFSPMLKGKGGKAIAVTFGVFAGTLAVGSNMLWSMAVVLIFFSAVVIINPHSLRMIVAMLMQIGWCIAAREPVGLLMGGIAVSLVVIVKHLMNYDKEKFTVKLPFRKNN